MENFIIEGVDKADQMMQQLFKKEKKKTILYKKMCESYNIPLCQYCFALCFVSVVVLSKNNIPIK